MKLSVILEQARFGELANVSEQNKTDRVVIAYINLALIALYNRFVLSTQEAIVTLRPDLVKTVYSLDGTDSDVRVKTRSIAENEFMAIVSVFNEDGSEGTVNDRTDPFSIYTVTYNQVQIPLTAKTAYVSIVFRTNPTLITFVDSGDGSATDTEVALPLQLLEAALHYIGYRAHGAINGNVQAENSTHFTRYLDACKRAEAQGIITAEDSMSTAVARKGFL